MNEVMEFYYKKKILVTGHTGFKGTWISEMLCQLGAIVWGYSLPVNRNSFFSKACPNVKNSIWGDIIDFRSLQVIVDEFCPDIIIHLASHSSLFGSMEIPHTIFSTNIMGVENVLECARLSRTVKSVIIVTSDKVYAGNGYNIVCTESSKLDATDPYGTSKVCQELLTRCYKETFTSGIDRFKVATARASNCISIGDDNNSRLFPYVLTELSSGRVPEIRHKDSIRSWQYVLDVLYGYLLLAKYLFESNHIFTVNDAYNFGPDKDGIKSVEYVVSRMCDLFDVDGFSNINQGDNIPSESEVLQIDSTLAQNDLNWERKVNLDDAIDRIVYMTKSIRNGSTVKKVVSDEVSGFLLL